MPSTGLALGIKRTSISATALPSRSPRRCVSRCCSRATTSTRPMSCPPPEFKRSFPPVVDARTRLLICGSLPGERGLAARRYYAHPQNQFWWLLSPIVGLDLAARDYDARLAALLEAHIGLWDVVAAAARSGSSDAAIRDLAANDLAALVATLPDLRAVAYNGGPACRSPSAPCASSSGH